MSAIIPCAGNATFILSAELDWRDDGRNLLAHYELRERLARQFELGELVSVAECRGAYKGRPERSIAITGLAGIVRAIARSEAEHFRQESVLGVTPDGNGVLLFTDATVEPDFLGKYTPIVSEDEADAWTRVLATGELFTFR